MQIQCVLCEIWTEFLNIIFMNFMFRRVAIVWSTHDTEPLVQQAQEL
jgi:ABC-type iron transport system FetAB ATPase subunit